MPKRLVDKLRAFIPGNGKKKPRQYQRQEIPRDQHNLSRSMISEAARKVLHRLNKSGFEAYLVGGGVRDILLGGQPKDFDIATSATPEQIKAVITGPISLTMEMPTILGIQETAPNSIKVGRVWSVNTNPIMNPVVATSISDLFPTW